MEEKEEQEKQYSLYLEEIVELRAKIKDLVPGKYDLRLETDSMGRPLRLERKKTKIYFLLTQLSSRV